MLKKVNTLLKKREVDMKKQCWKNSQYSRRECLEVVGIPLDTSNEDLESKEFEFFNAVDREIPSHNTEACRCLYEQ